MHCIKLSACKNPGRFVRGGPTLTKAFLFFLVDVGEKIQIPLKAGHHRPIKIAFYLRADDGPTLHAGLAAFFIFQGIRTSIAMKPYIFVIFQGGPDARPPPDPRMRTSIS